MPGREAWGSFAGTDLVAAIGNRKSHRRFKDEQLSLAELAFLLWSTQGIRESVGPGCAYRVVPSAGCRHAFETYLVVSSVGGLAPGVYRYLPVDHALVFEGGRVNLQAELSLAALNQTFVAAAPVVFVWATVPYRMEWRYGLAAHRVIAMDAGHVCQNLYLASQAVGCGTCAIAAYHQERMDRLLGLDGEDEFTLYMAPVGKV
ncbi:SagB/ThcOx family dehydrogenase [Desulfuromonas sp.]|uniref:SagB/ThcOx family dehydrogenase n=1 Tax=Desulfuromonas sp. TaxID=892 RepID=UPI0025C626FD|nr:SagB/ThcOx family dehydrogenase [Desulfuromonas sp.]